jgi:hypothetical protein
MPDSQCTAHKFTCKHPIPDWAIPLLGIAAAGLIWGLIVCYVKRTQPQYSWLEVIFCNCPSEKQAARHASVPTNIPVVSGQVAVPSAVPVQVANTNSVADELMKLKGLLDTGVLSQAEFEQQKQRLLA